MFLIKNSLYDRVNFHATVVIIFFNVSADIMLS